MNIKTPCLSFWQKPLLNHHNQCFPRLRPSFPRPPYYPWHCYEDQGPMFRTREQIVADNQWATCRKPWNTLANDPCNRTQLKVPEKGHLVGHDIPHNPHIRLPVEDCRRVKKEEVVVSQAWNLGMLSLFPDGTLLKEFKEGSGIFKCDSCPLFNDDCLVYSCVHVFA